MSDARPRKRFGKTARRLSRLTGYSGSSISHLLKIGRKAGFDPRSASDAEVSLFYARYRAARYSFRRPKDTSALDAPSKESLAVLAAEREERVRLARVRQAEREELRERVCRLSGYAPGSLNYLLDIASKAGLDPRSSTDEEIASFYGDHQHRVAERRAAKFAEMRASSDRHAAEAKALGITMRAIYYGAKCRGISLSQELDRRRTDPKKYPLLSRIGRLPSRGAPMSAIADSFGVRRKTIYAMAKKLRLTIPEEIARRAALKEAAEQAKERVDKRRRLIAENRECMRVISEHASTLSVSPSTIAKAAWRKGISLSEELARRLRIDGSNVYPLESRRGRPPSRGVPVSEIAASLGLTRQGLYKAAKVQGRTVDEEISYRESLKQASA